MFINFDLFFIHKIEPSFNLMNGIAYQCLPVVELSSNALKTNKINYVGVE